MFWGLFKVNIKKLSRSDASSTSWKKFNLTHDSNCHLKNTLFEHFTDELWCLKWMEMLKPTTWFWKKRDLFQKVYESSFIMLCSWCNRPHALKLAIAHQVKGQVIAWQVKGLVIALAIAQKCIFCDNNSNFANPSKLTRKKWVIVWIKVLDVSLASICCFYE